VKEYAVIAERGEEQKLLPGLGFWLGSEEEALGYVQYLLAEADIRKFAAEAEEYAGFPGGNHRSYYYRQDWEGWSYQAIWREVSKWERVE
jgi:hypothetical protein